MIYWQRVQVLNTVLFYLFPDWHHKDAPSSDVAQLSCSLETVMSPSPCIRATAANHRLPGIRARRLHLGQTSLECGRDYNRSSGTGKFTGDTDLRLQRVQQLARSNVPVLSLPARIPCPPPKNTLGEGKMDNNRFYFFFFIVIGPVKVKTQSLKLWIWIKQLN